MLLLQADMMADIMKTFVLCDERCPVHFCILNGNVSNLFGFDFYDFGWSKESQIVIQSLKTISYDPHHFPGTTFARRALLNQKRFRNAIQMQLKWNSNRMDGFRVYKLHNVHLKMHLRQSEDAKISNIRILWIHNLVISQILITVCLCLFSGSKPFPIVDSTKKRPLCFANTFLRDPDLLEQKVEVLPKLLRIKSFDLESLNKSLNFVHIAPINVQIFWVHFEWFICTLHNAPLPDTISDGDLIVWSL